MNTQYLQYVREQLIVATADLSGATKGQLVAFAENAMFEATPRSGKRMKVVDPATAGDGSNLWHCVNPGDYRRF